MSLTNKTLKDSYIDILQMDNSNGGVDSTVRKVKDGSGDESSISLSDDQFVVKPVDGDTVAAMLVQNKSGDIVLRVDTNNQLVYGSGNIVNTQYAYFGQQSANENFTANTHHPIPFQTYNATTTLASPMNFGTSTDPASSFTTSNSAGSSAADLVPHLWYVADNISIDAVYSIEGADAATGDTTRMHLFSYDFTSGSTSALTNGTLVAHNSDVTNDGNEQSYLSTWTVDSAAVTAGKVILAFLRSDSVNSDYSISIKIKYHLT